MEGLQLSGKQVGALRDYISGLYILRSEDEFLSFAVPRAAEILNIDYHAFILFPNRITRTMLIESNNPAAFTLEYTNHLGAYDPLMRTMIEGGLQQTPLSAVLSPAQKRTDLFYNECERLRPAGDGAYNPLVVDGMLAGFTGLVRSADNPAPLSRNELGLMRFMLSLWPDAITRLVDNQHQDDNSALLDMHGTVLYAGDSIRASLQAVFGMDGWQRSLSRTGPCAASFQQAFQAVRDPEAIRPSAECRFPGLTGPAVLRFRRIGSCSLRRYFPERPQVEVRLVAGRNNQLPFDSALCRRYALTQRETAIIADIYRGASNTTIAQELGISVATVKHHIYNIFNKVGVDSRTQLLFALSIH